MRARYNQVNGYAAALVVTISVSGPPYGPCVAVCAAHALSACPSHNATQYLPEEHNTCRRSEVFAPRRRCVLSPPLTPLGAWAPKVGGPSGRRGSFACFSSPGGIGPGAPCHPRSPPRSPQRSAKRSQQEAQLP